MTRKSFWSLIGILTAVRLVLAGQVGLGVDEAHYVLYGRHLDWSYFDHPPLVGWIHFLFQRLPIHGDTLARLPAILCSILTSYLAVRFLQRRGLSQTAAQVGVLALNSTLLFNICSLLFLPDTPLMPLAFLIVEAIEKTRSQPTIRSWAQLGLWLGLAGLSKYTAVLFLPGLVVYFFGTGRWREILTLRFAIGVLVAAVVVSPVLIWNIQNHFISFQYQSNHLLTTDNFSLNSFFQSQITQFVGWGLVFYLMAIRFVFWGRSPGTWVLFRLVSAFVGGFFLFISFFQYLLPHWMLVFFVMAIPASVAWAWQEKKFRQVWMGLGVSTLITLPVLVELGIHYLPGSISSPLYHDIEQWGEVMAEATRQASAEPPGLKGLAVTNWTLGSRAMYYNVSPWPIFVLDRKIDQFDLWNPLDPRGYDLILIVEEEKIQETLPQIECENLKKIGGRRSFHRGAIVHQFSYFACHNYKGLK